jgi:hypothetical protein
MRPTWAQANLAGCVAAVSRSGRIPQTHGDLSMMKRLLAVLFALCLAAPAFGQVTNSFTTPTAVVIATGNTFQGVLSALTQGQIRRSLTIQNNNSTDSCWLFIGATASATKATSILLLAGGSYTRYFPYVPSDNIAATCTTTSDTLYVDTQ